MACILSAGANVIVGHKREGPVYHATMLENVNKDLDVVANEAFAPVVVLEPYDTFQEALDKCAIRVVKVVGRLYVFRLVLH